MTNQDLKIERDKILWASSHRISSPIKLNKQIKTLFKNQAISIMQALVTELIAFQCFQIDLL